MYVSYNPCISNTQPIPDLLVYLIIHLYSQRK